MSQCSRWQISTSASHSSGSRRMLVLPRPATTLRLTNRLPVTAAPYLIQMPQGKRPVLRKWLSLRSAVGPPSAAPWRSGW